MSSAVLSALPLVFVLAGVVLYAVLAGADLGAGFWQLFAGGGRHGEEIREHAHHSMAPVWEANHVWLIFVLTVFWTAYPTAFGSIASTLAIPLFLAGIGIVFRGAAYALRVGAATPRELGVIDTVFSLSSILTPFALGAMVGGIATGRVPVGNAAGARFSSWLNSTSILVGVLAVATSAYLAAVYLAADAARRNERDLERAFRVRALGAGVVAGALALAGIFVIRGGARALYDELVSGRALPAVIVSAVAGLATLALVYRRRFEAARYTAALAVAAVVAGWALAQWPTILPGLDVREAAAPHDTLVAVVVAVLGGGAIVFPSLALLFRLALAGRFDQSSPASAARPVRSRREVRPALLVRTAVACLIVGFGLLTVANAAWAHAVGVTALFAFMVAGFLALAPADES
ncbi:MAG: Cytochrome bd-type quinol oxidase subunit 2-like protein [Actinomycetia bacterium]|nr:Cytochrome bd-type quinol oxidase subunit 2-like protein [Actinomycetes bacterium]